jgi:hypothetical protein
MIGVTVPPGQYLPAGQLTDKALPPAHEKQGGQMLQTASDVDVHAATLYLLAGHTLQALHDVAPETLVYPPPMKLHGKQTVSEVVVHTLYIAKPGEQIVQFEQEA